MRARVLSLLLFCIFCHLAPVLALTLEEPLEKRILTPVNPNSFPAGICPGNPAGSISQPPVRGSTFESRLVRDAHEVSAMQAATAIYKLGDLESFKDGEGFVEDTYKFFAAIPKGYRFYFYVSEPVSGLKYMVLQPTGAQPWILALAGTQSALDWIMDLDLGRAQFSTLSRLLGILTTCQYLDQDGNPLASKNWIVTGHSLGGGLAQGVAYEVQRRRFEKSLQPVRMELITFNAFGAQELIGKTQTYSPSIARYLDATHFFIRGDEVSRIGTHIGPAKELVAADGLSVIDRHAMDTILNLANEESVPLSGLAKAKPATPPARESVRALLPMASVLSRLAFAGYSELRDAQIVSRLSLAVAQVERLDFSDPLNTAVLMFTRRLLLSRIVAWDKPNSGIKRDLAVQELKSLYRRLVAASK